MTSYDHQSVLSSQSVLGGGQFSQEHSSSRPSSTSREKMADDASDDAFPTLTTKRFCPSGLIRIGDFRVPTGLLSQIITPFGTERRARASSSIHQCDYHAALARTTREKILMALRRLSEKSGSGWSSLLREAKFVVKERLRVAASARWTGKIARSLLWTTTNSPLQLQSSPKPITAFLLLKVALH